MEESEESWPRAGRLPYLVVAAGSGSVSRSWVSPGRRGPGGWRWKEASTCCSRPWGATAAVGERRRIVSSGERSDWE
jgi:hypothetical protein